MRHTIESTCAALTALGGPDLLSRSLELMETRVELDTDPALVGIYGQHYHQHACSRILVCSKITYSLLHKVALLQSQYLVDYSY